MSPDDEGLAPWELPDPSFHPEEHASTCRCEMCVACGLVEGMLFNAVYDQETGMLIRSERSLG
jgi:hypothetical protein